MASKKKLKPKKKAQRKQSEKGALVPKPVQPGNVTFEPTTITFLALPNADNSGCR